jgi:uncharacterized protein YndB with AHSA1/START domain
VCSTRRASSYGRRGPTAPTSAKWFGPKGFTCKTHEIEVKEGGRWRFELIAPDGKVWTNRVVFLEVKQPEKLVYDHGSDKDDDPHRFHVTITFDEQSNKKTVLTMRQLHPTAEQRKGTIAFGAVELGYQTLDKLAEHLQKSLV